MASPAPSNLSADAQQPTKAQEQITFRFCRECSNMLYPKEDRMTNKLMFACRTCQFSEEAISSCVFRNNMYNTVGETAGVTQDVGSDPTVRGFIDSHVFCCCCVLCGMELGEEEGEEEEEEEEGRLEGDGEEHEKGMNVTVFDLSEMSRMEDEDGDEEMGGEPDTTSDDMTSHYHDAEKGDVARGERNAHPNTNSERKTFLTTLG